MGGSSRGHGGEGLEAGARLPELEVGLLQVAGRYTQTRHQVRVGEAEEPVRGPLGENKAGHTALRPVGLAAQLCLRCVRPGFALGHQLKVAGPAPGIDVHAGKVAAAVEGGGGRGAPGDHQRVLAVEGAALSTSRPGYQEVGGVLPVRVVQIGAGFRGVTRHTSKLHGYHILCNFGKQSTNIARVTVLFNIVHYLHCLLLILDHLLAGKVGPLVKKVWSRLVEQVRPLVGGDELEAAPARVYVEGEGGVQGAPGVVPAQPVGVHTA